MSAPAPPGRPTAPAAPTKVLYILGNQRGGTTIAGRLIGELPGFSFVGELRKLWEVGLPQGRECGCGKAYSDCPVWTDVLAAVAGREPSEVEEWQRRAAPVAHSWLQAWRLSRQAPHRRPAAVRSYAAILCSSYKALALATNARVVVDGSKLPADAFVASLCEGVDTYYVQIVRDPRGVLCSQLRRSHASERISDRTGRPKAFHPRHGVYSAAAWTSRHLASAWLRRRLGPQRFLTLTYERLVAEPGACLSEVAAMMSEQGPAADMACGGTVSLRTAHTPIGNGRFGPTTVELARDDRWIKDLSWMDTVLTTALTGWLAVRFGYPVRPAATEVQVGQGAGRPDRTSTRAG